MYSGDAKNPLLYIATVVLFIICSIWVEFLQFSASREKWH
jgi:hypothetical protein